MFHNVNAIYLKEMKEVLRDRKTLIFMLVLPTLLIPLLINGMMDFMMKTEKAANTETIRYAIFGGENIPALAQEFEDNPGFESIKIESVDSINESIENGTIKMALIIPDDSSSRLKKGDQAQVKLYYNNASTSSKVESRASKLIREHGNSLRREQLRGLGVENSSKLKALIEPISLLKMGTADMREIIGEQVGGMLPYLFIIFAFMGALYPAIDLGAGEKERGTLETLLLTPVPRHHLVLGKFLVIFTTGFTAALLSLCSIMVWLLTKGQEVKGVLGNVISSVGSTDLGLIAFMLFPTTAIFAALLMCISIYAKSFKEAQSYATPLNFLAIIPAVMAMMPGIELDWKTAMIPVTNVSLAIKELIKGTMDYNMLVAIIGSSTFIAFVAIVFCAKWFERESVLFRE